MGGPTRIAGPIWGLTDYLHAIADGTLCRQLSPVPSSDSNAGDPGVTRAQAGKHTLVWDRAHLLHVVNALLVASKEETRERNALDREMIQLLNKGYLTQSEFQEITSTYYSCVSDALPYFVQTGKQIKASSAELQDMTEAKRLCEQWYELLVEIVGHRDTAAWHSGTRFNRLISESRLKLVDAERRYDKSFKIMNEWYKTISDAREVNKFVDELKSIKDMNDDIHSVIAIFKNPMKALKSQSLGKVKSKLSGGKDEWDVIKAGIKNLGDYLATTELVAYHKTTIKQELTNYSVAMEDIFKHSRLIYEFERQRTKIERLGELNPALRGVSLWGKI